MKTSFAWLPALFLIAAAVCAGESPAPEKPDADAKAKAEEQALQKRVEEVLKVLSSGEEKAISRLRESLAEEGESALPVLATAGYAPNLKVKVVQEIRETKKLLYRTHPNLSFKVTIYEIDEPVPVLPPDTPPFELTLKNAHLTISVRLIEIENICDIPIVMARPQEGSTTAQKYPYYQFQFLDQNGKVISRDSKFDLQGDPPYEASDFLALKPNEYWGTRIYMDWPSPPKPGKYKMRLRYVMPKAEHKCADEAAKKLAEEASIGEVFSNTVDVEFVFPSNEELKKMGVVQDEKEEKSAKKEKDEK